MSSAIADQHMYLAKPPYLRRCTARCRVAPLLLIRQQAQPGQAVGAAAHLAPLIVVAGDPQPGRRDQHVVGAEPASPGVKPRRAARIQHQAATRWVQTRDAWSVKAA